ncbi:hypothetical protein BT96DRAFT_313295 [Gymnopus androsaceus JB14]|uniref:Uncharacterized protein n=1 Tax=Gymnopus androsaceus JB14 TaxID=1447944 RepID=A0A6A4I4I8_9AGAR|nr:hypothetical protein BT96DRAFT_313295 [Gymnopus androsaceus JB14]
MQPSSSRSSSSENTPVVSPAQPEASISSPSTRAIQEQFATLKRLLTDQIDECREGTLRSEEMEREREHIRVEEDVQNEEMKDHLHGALEAQKSLASISSELTKSQGSFTTSFACKRSIFVELLFSSPEEDMEKIRKVVEETQKAQEAELAATLEENLRYKRQKHEELMEILRTR